MVKPSIIHVQMAYSPWDTLLIFIVGAACGVVAMNALSTEEEVEFEEKPKKKKRSILYKDGQIIFNLRKS